MPITPIEVPNILGSYVQGLELGRQARAQRAKEAQALELRNMLAAATPEQLEDPRFINQLIVRPGGAEIAKPLAESLVSRQGMRKNELEIMKLEVERLAGEAGSFLQAYQNNPASLNKAAVAPWLNSAVRRGLMNPEDLQTFEAMPDDPTQLAIELKKLEEQGMSVAQRVDAKLRQGTLDVQERQAQTAAEREARLSREGKGGVATSGPPTKLKQGERWNEELQRVEAVPGSELYQKQKKIHGKDYDVVKSTSYEANLGRSKIDKLLDPSNEKEFKNLFGGYSAYATGRLSGKTATLRTELNSLKSNLKTAGKRIISAAGSGAIGQITEREWPILESMIGELVPEMDTPGARAKLEEIRAQLTKMEDLARESYDETWGESQYYSDIPRTTGAAPSVGSVADPAAAARAELERRNREKR